MGGSVTGAGVHRHGWTVAAPARKQNLRRRLLRASLL
jgi:hypothetical protein